MDTKERLEKYRELVKSGTQEEIGQFIQDNSDDKRFISLVETHTEFVEAVKESLT